MPESATRTRLDLRPDRDVAARAAALAVDETGCCSFFDIHLSIDDGTVALDIGTAPEHQDMLAALTARDISRWHRVMSGVLRAGQVAEAVGINVETLRYYGQRGILSQPDRSPGGHRLYPETTVTTLRVFKAAQNLGFTLEEVVALLDAGRHRHDRAQGGLQARSEAKLAEVERKIADLQAIRPVSSPRVMPGVTICFVAQSPIAALCSSGRSLRDGIGRSREVRCQESPPLRHSRPAQSAAQHRCLPCSVSLEQHQQPRPSCSPALYSPQWSRSGRCPLGRATRSPRETFGTKAGSTSS